MLLQQILLLIVMCSDHLIDSRFPHQMQLHINPGWKSTARAEGNTIEATWKRKNVIKKARSDVHGNIRINSRGRLQVYNLESKASRIEGNDMMQHSDIFGMRKRSSNILLPATRRTRQVHKSLPNGEKTLLDTKNYLSKPGKREKLHIDAPQVVPSVYRINADVGVAFQRYIAAGIFVDKDDGNARSLNVELLTADKKRIFDTSWIKFDQSNLRLYGFPLEGNQDNHVFYLKATNSKGMSAYKTLHVFVQYLPKNFNHYVEICTTMTFAEYAGSVEQRIGFASSVGDYVFPGGNVDNVWILEFQGGCITIVFRQLLKNKKCDFDAVAKINNSISSNGMPNDKLRQALRGITVVKSVNITLLKECKTRNGSSKGDGLGWLRDIAPVFILLAVVAIPTMISCIVCKEVRRRQALMRQIQDQRMKEEREQMLIQAAEYKHECGLSSESEEEEPVCTTLRRKSEQQLSTKEQFGFSRFAQMIIPDAVMDKVKQGTELLHAFLPQDSLELPTSGALESAQKKVAAMASLHPNHRLLDMSQEEQLQKEKASKSDQENDNTIKKLVRFMKNPLEIKQMAPQQLPKCKEENTSVTIESIVPSKHTTFSISNFLPSIYSLLRTLGDNNSRMDHTVPAKTGIGLVENSTASLSSTTTARTSTDANSQTVSTNTQDDAAMAGAFDSSRTPRNNYLEKRQAEFIEMTRFTPCRDERTRQIVTPYFNTYVQSNVPCLGQDSIVEKHFHVKSKSQGNEKENSLEEKGLIRKIVDNGLRLVRFSTREEFEIEHKTTSVSKGIQNAENIKFEPKCNLEQQAFEDRLMTATFNQNKHHSKMDLSYRLAGLDDAQNIDEQLWDLKLRINDNQEADYSHTTPLLTAKKIKEKRFSPRSESLKSFGNRHGYQDNLNLCFVNIPSQQVLSERFTNESFDESSFSNHSETEAFDYDTRLGQAVPHLEGSCTDTKLPCNTPFKGLLHYDPLSDSWYHSSPRTRGPDKVDMFSIEGNSSGINPRLLDNEIDMHDADENEQSNLVWHDLSAETSQCLQDPSACRARKQRRKIGLMLEHEVHVRARKDGWSPCHQEWVTGQAGCEEQARSSMQGNEYQYDECRNMYETTQHRTFIDNAEICQGGEEMQFSDATRGNFEMVERFVEDDDFYRSLHDCEKDIGSYDCLDCEAIHESMTAASIQRSQQEQYRNGLHYRRTSEYPTFLAGNGRRRREDVESMYNEDIPRETINIARRDGHNVQPHNQNYEQKHKTSTDSSVSLSPGLASQESSGQSEISTDKSSLSSNSKRRRSMLERQNRVEIPEQVVPKSPQIAMQNMKLNPLSVINEGQQFDITDDRGHPDGHTDIGAVTGRKISISMTQCRPREERNLPYGESFSKNDSEAEQIRQQDMAIMEEQMKNYLKMTYQHPRLDPSVQDQARCHPAFIGESNPPLQNRRIEQICGKRDDLAKRPGMRRFSTPSMESWTSTPEKYYYDATGDSCISEEDVSHDGIRNDQQKQFFIGRGRAREYTSRLFKGVSPKIRRHSTSVMGRKQNFTSSTNEASSSASGTFLGKIGEGRLVQTIQTKLGRKESRSDEPKSPKLRDQDKNLDDDKNCKGSPLNAIRHKLYLLSGGK